MDETPEQKYARLQREIQNAILSEYPNPERRGCPGRTVVESFAKNPDQITVEEDRNPDSKWYHITHCSPCYAEFLELRDGLSGEASARADYSACCDSEFLEWSWSGGLAIVARSNADSGH